MNIVSNINLFKSLSIHITLSLYEILHQPDHKLLHTVKVMGGFSSHSLPMTSYWHQEFRLEITYILLNITNIAHESLCTYLSVLFALQKHVLGDGKYITFLSTVGSAVVPGASGSKTHSPYVTPPHNEPIKQVCSDMQWTQLREQPVLIGPPETGQDS